MTAIAEKLDPKLTTWNPATASEVALLVGEIMELADSEALDVLRGRHVEQEVLDVLDEDASR